MNFPLYLAAFLLLDLVLVGYIVYRISRKGFSDKDLSFFRTQWQKIQSEADLRHGILNADKLLHTVLSKKGYQGNVGDQLKKAGKIFSNVNDVWFAHKLRNRIAHELDFHGSLSEMKRALQHFEKALKDLGAL